MGRRGPVTRAVGRERRDSRGRARAEVRGGRARRGGEDILGGGGEPAPAPLATRPVSTGGGTRRVQSVREGWGGGGAAPAAREVRRDAVAPEKRRDPVPPEGRDEELVQRAKGEERGGRRLVALARPGVLSFSFFFLRTDGLGVGVATIRLARRRGPVRARRAGVLALLEHRVASKRLRGKDETCPLSMWGRTRRVRLVWGEGRDEWQASDCASAPRATRPSSPAAAVRGHSRRPAQTRTPRFPGGLGRRGRVKSLGCV
jgi:hypothetical protein